jgi:hypothetical protein
MGGLAGRAKVVTSTIILIEPLLVVTLADSSKVVVRLDNFLVLERIVRVIY